MNNTYNSNIYLNKNDLNEIEGTIESLTEEVQEKIFNNQSSPLRNIRVGDDLSGKILYLSFPRNLYEDIDNTTIVDIVTVNSDKRIRYQYTNSTTHYVAVGYGGQLYVIYGKIDSQDNPYFNFARYKLPNDFGVVTSIIDDDVIYQYIKIYDDENIIPDYEKHTWAENEVLSMQKIDNIENGIKNIGYYYYQPKGWLSNREWLGVGQLGKGDNNGMNVKNISYQDLNRWVTDLNLINFDNLNDITIWNTNISQINWNENNDVEWEDY